MMPVYKIGCGGFVEDSKDKLPKALEYFFSFVLLFNDPEWDKLI